MKIALNNKIYEQTKIKGRATRRFLEVKELLASSENKGDFTTTDFDIITTFIVDIFGNQFTTDDILDELDTQEIFSVFTDVCREIGEKMSGKVQQFEKK